jgi:hypothetical protein
LRGNTGDTIYSVGNDASTTTGNVGIGTVTPTTLLSIGPNPVAALGAQELLQLGRATDAFLTVNDGTARGIFGSSSGLPFAGSQSNHDFVLRSNNLERMRITSAGNVGIGTVTPAARLDVAGETKIGNTNVACSVANEGSQRYNSSTKIMEFCNGTAWGAMGGGAMVSRYGSGNRCPSDNWIAACLYMPGLDWSWNVCISRGHTVGYGWSLVWVPAVNGYQMSGVGYTGTPVDAICG